MKKRMRACTLIFLSLTMGLIAFSSTAQAGRQSSTNYIIQKDVLSCGGGDMGSAQYDIFSTAGQASAVGHSSSSSHINLAGFWHWIEVPLKNMGIPWIFLLLLGD